MAIGLRFKVSGVPSLARRLRAIGVAQDTATRTEVKRALLNIEAGAKRRCPVRTGRLRSSIAHEVDEGGMNGTVGTNVEYGPFVEHGTARTLAAGPTEFKAGGGRDAKGRFTKNSVLRKGGYTPFLFPAAEEERPEYQRRLTAALARASERT